MILTLSGDILLAPKKTNYYFSDCQPGAALVQHCGHAL
jgi:hypothetical protein